MNMQNGFVRITAQAFALVLIAAGAVGLFLPFLQGILMLAAGLYILSIASPGFKHRMDRVLSNFPRLKAHIDRQHECISRWFKRRGHDHR